MMEIINLLCCCCLAAMAVIQWRKFTPPPNICTLAIYMVANNCLQPAVVVECCCSANILDRCSGCHFCLANQLFLAGARIKGAPFFHSFVRAMGHRHPSPCLPIISANLIHCNIITTTQMTIRWCIYCVSFVSYHVVLPEYCNIHICVIVTCILIWHE